MAAQIGPPIKANLQLCTTSPFSDIQVFFRCTTRALTKINYKDAPTNLA